jgi:acyl-CoA oxidase
MTAFEALVDCQDHVVHLAESHIERVIAEQFIARVEGCEDDDLRAQLERLCSLYLLHVLEEDMGWFMRQDFIENPQAEAIVAEINALCSEIREQAVPLVDGFGIPDKLVGAPIAFHPLGGLPDTPETSPIQ